MRRAFECLLLISAAACACDAKRTYAPDGKTESDYADPSVMPPRVGDGKGLRAIDLAYASAERPMDYDYASDERPSKRRLRLWDYSDSEEETPQSDVVWDPGVRLESMHYSLTDYSDRVHSATDELFRGAFSEAEDSLSVDTHAGSAATEETLEWDSPTSFFEYLLVTHEWLPERPERKGSKVGSKRKLRDGEILEFYDEQKFGSLMKAVKFIRAKGYNLPFHLSWDDGLGRWSFSKKPFPSEDAGPLLRVTQRALEHYVNHEWVLATEDVYRQLGVVIPFSTADTGRWRFARRGPDALHAWHVVASQDGTPFVQDDLILWRVHQTAPEKDWFTGACEPGGKVFSLRYLLKEREVVLGVAQTIPSGQQLARRWVLSEAGPARPVPALDRVEGTCMSVGLRDVG